MGNKKNQKKTAPKNAAGAKTRAKSNKTNSKPASDDEETEAKKMERACNTRNHQVRSLANEMDIKPSRLRLMMDDVTDKKEDGTSTFNQPEWKKLNAMVPVATKYARPMKVTVRVDDMDDKPQEHLMVVKKGLLKNAYPEFKPQAGRRRRQHQPSMQVPNRSEMQPFQAQPPPVPPRSEMSSLKSPPLQQSFVQHRSDMSSSKSPPAELVMSSASTGSQQDYGVSLLLRAAAASNGEPQVGAGAAQPPVDVAHVPPSQSGPTPLFPRSLTESFDGMRLGNAPSATPATTPAIQPSTYTDLTPAQKEELKKIDEEEEMDLEEEAEMLKGLTRAEESDAKAREQQAIAGRNASETRKTLGNRAVALYTAKKQRRDRRRLAVSAPPKSSSSDNTQVDPADLLHQYSHNATQTPSRLHPNHRYESLPNPPDNLENQDPNHQT